MTRTKMVNTRGFVAARLETRVGSNAVAKGNPFACAFAKATQ
tara:strand:- start:1420 stop:1545 length:126 start_codon:yes stop_codon:yes gene_type:complete